MHIALTWVQFIIQYYHVILLNLLISSSSFLKTLCNPIPRKLCQFQIETILILLQMPFSMFSYLIGLTRVSSNRGVANPNMLEINEKKIQCLTNKYDVRKKWEKIKCFTIKYDLICRMFCFVFWGRHILFDKLKVILLFLVIEWDYIEIFYLYKN